MGLGEAISMDDIKKRLETIEKHMPGEHGMVYDFCNFLAERLKSRLDADGFNVTFHLALADIRRGVNSITGKPIPPWLTGYPDVVYLGLEMNLPRISKAVCPEGFASEVEEVYKKIHK